MTGNGAQNMMSGKLAIHIEIGMCVKDTDKTGQRKQFHNLLSGITSRQASMHAGSGSILAIKRQEGESADQL